MALKGGSVKIQSIVISLFFTFFISLSSWAIECASVAQLKAGVFEPESSFVETAHYSPSARKMRRFLRESVARQSKQLKLTEQKRGICRYTDKQSDLQLQVKETAKYRTVSLTKSYSIESDDDDLEIYRNDLIVLSHRELKKGNQRSLSLKVATPAHAFSYYYSCGFVDCTSSADLTTELGKLKSVSLVW